MTVNITSKGWLSIAFVAVILACLFLTFRGCDKTPEVAAKPDPVRLIDSLKIDSLEKANVTLRKKDSASQVKISELETQQRSDHDLMRRANKQLRKFIDKATVAKASGDTTLQKEALDSLKYAAVVAVESSTLYQSSTEELFNAWQEDRKVCQQEIAVQRERANSFEAAFNSEFKARQELTVEFNNLGDKYNKVLKKKKRETTITRILAGLLLITAGAGFAK